MTRLATRNHRASSSVPEWEMIKISYVIGNVTEVVTERLAKKKLCMRETEENQHAHRRECNQEKKDGEEEALEKRGKAAE
jgi:hypothetical protein